MVSEDDTPAVAVADSGPAGDPHWNSDFDGISLGPVCHIQRAESRFGPHVSEEIRQFVFEDAGGGTQVPIGFDDDDDDDDEDEEEEEDDLDDIIDLATILQSQPSTGTNPFWPQSHPEETQSADSSSNNHSQGPGFPRMARLRCNLTAISQRFNVYFAAYQDKIYVYQPRAPPEILPGPSLVLHPKRTKTGKIIGGAIDRTFPHQINNMVVGNLGNPEVLLFVFDDGDVGAYYTHTIVRAILANEEQRQGTGIPGARLVVPRQFFSENVGQSAWGVAIHEKSRLLAVSSNRHEVTVFAFALKGQSSGSRRPDGLDRSPKVWSGQTAVELERHFRSRTRTWRVILPIGPQGHNIPTIAFLSDTEGNAVRIVALDIYENTWILNIWKIGFQPLLVPGTQNRSLGIPQRFVGWGVLVLPDSSFMYVRSVREAVGVPGDQIIDSSADLRRNYSLDRRSHGIWLDTTCSLYYVKDLASDPDSDLRSRFGTIYSSLHSRERSQLVEAVTMENEPSDEEMEHDTDISEQHSEAESAESVQPKSSENKKGARGTENKMSGRWKLLSKYPGPKGSVLDDVESETQTTRVIIPIFGETPRFDGSSSNSFMELLRTSSLRKNRSEPTFLSDTPVEDESLSILRATMPDIELLSLDPSSASVQCRCVVTYHNHHRRRQQPHDLAPNISERISMLIHVPELNLVVAGALNGRVALITLTKTSATVRGRPLKRGFRVDYVLPRRSDEEERLRPWCTLHGIAMSLVPDPHARGLQLADRGRIQSWAPSPPRYRLILHYLDHTILLYYIERKGEELLVF